MTNDGDEPLITPLNNFNNGMNNSYNAFVGSSFNGGAGINYHSGIMMGSTELGNRSDYVGKLGPAIGIYSTDQFSLVQDWH